MYQPNRNLFLHLSDKDSSDAEADSDNACIYPELPAVETYIDVTLHMDNPTARKPIYNNYFHLFNNRRDQ